MRRGFPAEKINQKWFGDGTEIGTAQGKLHLASVLDMGSRRIVGFALAEHHDAELAYGALAMAVAVRGGQVTGVIMHTDQGSEYTAGGFRAACTRLGIRQSMGRPGSALDNAVIESFHSTLEFELRRLEHFATRAQARARVAAWIEEYNRTRRHSACDMMSPVAWELALSAGPGPRDPGRPLRGPDQAKAASPLSFEEGCRAGWGTHRAWYGAAPPASRLLRIATRRPRGPALTLETSAAPQAGNTGRP